MAETTAPRAREGEAAVDHLIVAGAVEPESARFKRNLVAVSVGYGALLIGFLLFGVVTVGAGTWAGARMSVRRIWTRFTEFLGEEWGSAWASPFVLALVIISLTGSFLLIFLAMNMKDPDGSSPADDAELS